MFVQKLSCGVDENKDSMEISLNELITALSAAFDLAESSDRRHSLRTAYIATRIAMIVQMSEQEAENIYFASLLHDLIPPASFFDQSLIFDILDNLPLMPQVAEQVSKLWKYKQRNQPGKLLSQQLPVSPRIIYLAEQFEDIYSCGDKNEYLLRRTLSSWTDQIVKETDPNIGDALHNCMTEEAFWQDLKENRIYNAIRQMAPDSQQQLDIDAIEKVSRSFSLLIDRKNPYTGRHSQRVGMIAGSLAQLDGLDTGIVRKVSIAGYLHDLGKLSVSEQIINKMGCLTEEERQIINAHPYDSYAVLSEIKGFADIARWAGNHHERIDGSGYPWGRNDLNIIDQIIAVADIYEALTANRPYRRALETVDALKIIGEQVSRGEIMPEAYDLLETAVGSGGQFFLEEFGIRL